MQKNKLDGVVPFNEFFFRSCYYHQLIAGLSCLGIERDAVLLNAFTLIRDDFSTENEWFLDEKKLEKAVGYRNKKCNINKRKLIRCIDKGRPVIVGVDCYYAESREDTYKKQHAPHFVLVYGYDLEHGEVNVVDHRFLNSLGYMEGVFFLDNLLYANKMFRTGILKRKKTCYILRRRKTAGGWSIRQYINEEIVRVNKEKSIKNLETLDNMLKHDLDGVKEKRDKIIQYLQDMRAFYFTLSKTKFFLRVPEQRIKAELLVSGYSNILSVFRKVRVDNDYGYISKKAEIISRKIDEIKENEIAVNDYFAEVCQDA